MRPWQANENAETFETFFVRHMHKITTLRARAGGGAWRYVSKNNTNIARLSFLKRLFPDSAIVVPFRRPLSQAISLQRQHLRFLDIHAQSRFSRQYMRWLGHLEFGANLAPIRFDGFEWEDLSAARAAHFWLRYWVAAHEQILAERSHLTLVNYEAMCARPLESVAALASALGEPAGLFAQASGRLRPVPTGDAEGDAVDPALLQRAEEIYAELSDHSITKTAG